MWCKDCGQDVPGVYSAEAEKYCCPRCGDGLSAAAPAAVPVKAEVVAEAKPAAPGRTADQSEQPGKEGCPPTYDAWGMDQRLRHIERVLGKGKCAGSQRKTAYKQEVARLDGPHAGPVAWHQPQVQQRKRRRSHGANEGSTGLQVVTWTALALGMMAFVCGGVLLGWSMTSGREDLWATGTPIALGGLIGLLVGLVLQLDRLGHDNRQAVAKLDRLDSQLHDLKNTTTLLTTGQSSPGSAFYAHMAGGTNPQLLLTDLKGQLDLLAMKMQGIED